MREFETIFDLMDKKLLGYEVLYRGVENEGFSSWIEKVETGKDLVLAKRNGVCLIQGRILGNGLGRT